jgi:sugar lactone lactonase YvrE
LSHKVVFLAILALLALALFLLDVNLTSAQPAIQNFPSTPTPTPNPLQLPFDTTQEVQQKSLAASVRPSGSPVRGMDYDWWADVVVGQPDFGQITPDEVVANRLFNPGGVLVDRSVVPNAVYVYDAGNSRILGFSSLGDCSTGKNEGSPCTISKSPDIIIGQPSANSSGCNGDSGFQTYPNYPQPSARSLCGLRPDAVSILEGGSGATMAADAQGNLYHPDYANNRVLRFNNPLKSDAVADFVWGQPNFRQGGCNEGRGYNFDAPDADSLCFLAKPGLGSLRSGVAIDSSGNLWVADTQNHRVLRFPYHAATGAPAKTADLVLGQARFTASFPGTSLKMMTHPASVRVDAGGVVYVLDNIDGSGGFGRLLIFRPPLASGMAASQAIDLTFEPTGLELDADGKLWVNDSDHQRILVLKDGQLKTAISPISTGAWGGIGIDQDGNVILAGWSTQQVEIYSPPDYEWTSTLLPAQESGYLNQIGGRGMSDPGGMEVTGDQLIVADRTRLLFWNHPEQLTTNYPHADGVIGQPDFSTRQNAGSTFGRMRADTQGILWVLRGNADLGTKILGYPLPLVSQEEPAFEIASPLPLQGGGSFSWSGYLHLGGIAYQPECDCLWVSDRAYSRVFRIRDIRSSRPVVDIVLGQKSAAGTSCNQSRDLPDAYGRPQFPSADSLCYPGGLAFDRQGNLFVADHNLELAGNWRLLEYDAASLPPAPQKAVFGIAASRVYGRNGSFTEANCLERDPMCGPWEPAFLPNNDMVIGFNGYLGSPFPQVYRDPLNTALPYAALGDFYSHAYSIRVDSRGDLYVLDLTRSRVLIYRQPQSTFVDVQRPHWALDFIERLSAAGVTAGCGPAHYCPEETVTRAQMAVFLLRGIHGSAYTPPALAGKSGFEDVGADYWAAAWIRQLAEEGITGGCGPAYYCPEEPTTRAQMAVFLLRARYGSSYVPPALSGDTGFADVPADHWAAAWIRQLVQEGITAGCGNGNFCPDEAVSRAQMAVFLVKTFGLVP